MEAHEGLVSAVREALATGGDPGRAVAQQAYMKSAMPYRGFTAPELRRLLRPLFADPALRPVDRDQWAATVRELWDGATHREEWYAAIALGRHRLAAPWRDASMLPLWRHLLVTGAWWDVVDEIASHLVGDALRDEPAVVEPVLRAWAVDEDLWLRRTAIIAQLGHGPGTDLDLLGCALESNLEGSRHGREFFVRKAVGWALRDLASTDPAWVRAFVAGHADRMSGLSRREALKHVGG